MLDRAFKRLVDADRPTRKRLALYYLRKATLLSISILLSPLARLLARTRIRFLVGGCHLDRIGHTALEPDLYVKSEILGWRPRYSGILLAPDKSVVNPCLLHYWKSYIRIIRNPFLVKLLRPLAINSCLQYDPLYVNFPNGNRVVIIPAVYPIQAKYEAAYGGQPLLSLSPSDVERGWRCLQRLGVPRDAWFVCLHVRAPGYLPDDACHSYRDADIYTYLPAIEEIVRRGGWALRMGDPTMKRLPRMNQVIDYAHSEVRSDWMDVFCLAQCKFLLGTTSGPFNVSFVFGVPCACTNFVPMGHGTYSSKDLFIPKLYWDLKDGRYLTFSEVLRSPLRALWETRDYEAAGITLVDNSPEEIRDLAVEMMDRLNGTVQYTPEDHALQKRFKSLLEVEPLFGTCSRVGRDFLRKYAWLLQEHGGEPEQGRPGRQPLWDSKER